MTEGHTPTERRPLPRPTRLGWAVVTALVVLVAVALVASNDLLALAGAMAVVAAYASIWVLSHSPSLDVRHQVSPWRLPAGSRGAVTIAVRNSGNHRSPVVRIRRPVPPPLALDGPVPGLPIPDVTVPPLRPRETCTRTLDLTWASRGVFDYDAVYVDISDPFGLARKRTHSATSLHVVVHPRVVPLAVLPPPAGPSSWESDDPAAAGFDGDEFHAIRDYVPGDDLRRVHWALTARTGELMIREDRPTARAQLTVLLDLRVGRTDRASFEAACSAAASIVVRTVAGGRSVRLFSSDGTRSAFGHTEHHADQLLDRLAAARPHVGGPVTLSPADPERADDVGSLVVVSAGDGPPSDLLPVSAQGAPGRLTLVTFGPWPARRRASAGPASLLVVRVDGERSFQAAWDATVGATI